MIEKPAANALPPKKFNKDAKVPMELGMHTARIIRNKDKRNDTIGRIIDCDFEVVSGPTPAGHRDSAAVFYDKIYPSKNFPYVKCVAEKVRDVYFMTMACLGYGEAEYDLVPQGTPESVNSDAQPCLGRLVRVRVYAETNKNTGKEYRKIELLPYVDGEHGPQAKIPLEQIKAPAPTPALVPTAAPAPAAPELPVPAAAPAELSPREKAEKDGWAVHPKSAAHMYRGNEVGTIADVCLKYV